MKVEAAKGFHELIQKMKHMQEVCTKWVCFLKCPVPIWFIRYHVLLYLPKMTYRAFWCATKMWSLYGNSCQSKRNSEPNISHIIACDTARLISVGWNFIPSTSLQTLSSYLIKYCIRISSHNLVMYSIRKRMDVRVLSSQARLVLWVNHVTLFKSSKIYCPNSQTLISFSLFIHKFML